MQRKKIGIALSGGGARGLAHIGVLRVLVENDIPIDLIAGTSAGSAIGAAFAAGMSVDEIVGMARKVGWTNMTQPSLSLMGLLSNAPLGTFIQKEFPATRFEDLKMPFAAIGCDLESGAEVVFKDGDLPFAIRASCAIPGVFAPLVDNENRLLVDGGVVSPMPADTVRLMGADIVIAVDLMACGASFLARPRTAVGIMFQSSMLMLRTASQNQHYRADTVIIPQIAHLRPDQVNKIDEFIALGAAAAEEKIDEIRKIINQ